MSGALMWQLCLHGADKTIALPLFPEVLPVFNRLSLSLLVSLMSLPAFAGKVTTKLPYTYVRAGAADVVRTTTPGVALMGGAYDVDEAFAWMCQLGGNGDFLTVRATGTVDEYNLYVPTVCPGANSVATLIIPNLTAANHPDVAALIAKAEVVFIAGGDQGNYVSFWTGTPVQQALNQRIAAGVPVGGISAGLAVLGQYVFSATTGGVTSSAALADPFNRYMTFVKNFVDVPVLQGVLGDTHFSPRDRMGRELAFLARLSVSFGVTSPRSIAVDEAMAVLVDAQGLGTVVRQTVPGQLPADYGHVYFVKAPGAPQVCAAKKPLTYLNVDVVRLGDGETFDVRGWARVPGLVNDFIAYQVSATAGVMSSTQANGSLY